LLTSKGLTYYRSEDTSEPQAGTIPLNCLCSIDPLSEAQHKETGYFTVRLHARRHIHELSTKSQEEATKWMIALQDAIDSSPPIQTLTERLILSLIVNPCVLYVLECCMIIWYFPFLFRNHGKQTGIRSMMLTLF
jgi:hypothetical protein